MAEDKAPILSIPFARVDKDKREIWGWATTEQVAADGRVLSFEASCDAFDEWMKKGIIRSVHAPNPVAKAFFWQPDPESRRILIGTRVSRSSDGDDVLTKAEEGLLTGFSVRGTIINQRTQIVRSGAGQATVPYVTKYRIKETSYVDYPSDGGALFTDIVRSLDDGELTAPDEPVPGDPFVRADGDHDPCGSADKPMTHTHAHPAFGASGDDANHTHEHEHAGDANHHHAHEDVSRAEAEPPAGEDVERDEAHEAADHGDHDHPEFEVERAAYGGLATLDHLQAKGSHSHAHSHGGTTHTHTHAHTVSVSGHHTGVSHSHTSHSIKRDELDVDAENAIERAAFTVSNLSRAADISKADRAALADKGQALPDGSYPIPDKEHLHAAIVLAQSGHGDVDAAKRLIKRRAKELDATDMLPESMGGPDDDVKRDDGEMGGDSADGEMEDMRRAQEIIAAIKELIARESDEANDPANPANESWGLKMLYEALTHMQCFISGEASELAQMMSRAGTGKEDDVTKEEAEQLSGQVAELITRVQGLEDKGAEIERANPIGALAEKVEGLEGRLERVESQEAPSGLVRRVNPAIKAGLLGSEGEPPTLDRLEEAIETIKRSGVDDPAVLHQLDMLGANVAVRNVFRRGPVAVEESR